MEITPDLPAELVPLAWLVGEWQGVGVVGYPTTGESRFGQQIAFSHNGKPFLSYRSRTWLLDEDGEAVRPLATETGFWRPRPDLELEVVLAHATGIVEIYLGRIEGTRIEMRTDAVARTDSATEYTAGHRLYGRVEGDLLWAFDMAAMGQPLQPHASARLERV